MLPQLFREPLQAAHGNTAERYAPDALNGAGAELKVKERRRLLCVLTEHLKEVAHLIHQNIIGVRGLCVQILHPPRGGFHECFPLLLRGKGIDLRNRVSVLVKGKGYVAAVALRDSTVLCPALRFDIFQPLLGKGAEIVPQLRYPFTRLRVDALIKPQSVLLVSQRFQRALVPVDAEGHFRVVHHIAVLQIGVRHGDLVLTDILDDKRHIPAIRSGAQL